MKEESAEAERERESVDVGNGEGLCVICEVQCEVFEACRVRVSYWVCLSLSGHSVRLH